MFSISKATCGVLVLALATPTLALAADDSTNTPARATLRQSVERAARTEAAGLSRSNAATTVPLSLPRPSRAKKGMGTGMMIMSLVGTAAGIAGTYYMVKTIKDQTKTQPGS